MTITIPTIVEGQGEVQALPVLLRRLGKFSFPDHILRIPPPHRLSRGKIIHRPSEFERAIQLAAAKGGKPEQTLILILLDSDDDCPVQLGSDLTQKAQALRPDFLISVSLAVREFEAWILASALSLRNVHGFAQDLAPPEDPESIRDAKGWLKKNRSPESYSETIDQPRFTSRIDLTMARQGSKSFDRFCLKFEEGMSQLISS